MELSLAVRREIRLSAIVIIPRISRGPFFDLLRHPDVSPYSNMNFAHGNRENRFP